jgi:UDP-N-acetyl-D-mannosaminuronate dehydrogenase
VRPSREHGHFAGIASVTLDDIRSERFEAAIISTGHDNVDHDALATRLPLVVDTRGVCAPAPNVVKA